MAKPLGLIGFGDAADVLFKALEAQVGAGSHKGLKGNAEAGIELAGELPGQGVEDGNEVAQVATGGEGTLMRMRAR